MSRVGKNAVEVPQGVEVKIDGKVVTAKGQQGQLVYEMTDDVVAEMAEGNITVRPLSESKQARAMWGTARSRIQSLVTGVTEGFRRDQTTWVSLCPPQAGQYIWDMSGSPRGA